MIIEFLCLNRAKVKIIIDTAKSLLQLILSTVKKSVPLREFLGEMNMHIKNRFEAEFIDFIFRWFIQRRWSKTNAFFLSD